MGQSLQVAVDYHRRHVCGGGLRYGGPQPAAPLSLVVEIIGDALPLIILTIAVLYYFSYKPVLRHIEKRHGAELALKHSERALCRLSNQLLNTHEVERHHITAGLHNDLAPKVSAVKLKVESVMHLIDAEENPDIEAQCPLI